MDRPPDLVAADCAAGLGLPAPVHLRSGENHVYRAGGVLLRIGPNPADRTLLLHRHLASRGVAVTEPVADPLTRDGWHVSLWRWIEDDADFDHRRLGEQVRLLHSIPIEETVAAVGRLPWCGDADWLDVPSHLERIIDLGLVTPDQAQALTGVWEGIADWKQQAHTEPAVLCHGDLHPGNIVSRHREPVLLDIDGLCLGPPQWDHAPLLTWGRIWGGRADDYPTFADGYGYDYRTDLLAGTLATLRLLAPTVNMVLRGHLDDRHHREGRRRLRYWMDDPGWPTWQPQ